MIRRVDTGKLTLGRGNVVIRVGLVVLVGHMADGLLLVGSATAP